MAVSQACSALSSLIQNAQLKGSTSIELLQIGRSAPGTTAPIFYATLEDEIVSYIGAGESLKQVGRENHSVAERGIDNPGIQILQVLSSF